MIAAYRDQVAQFLGRQALEDAKAHARAEFPKESCGFITSSYKGQPSLYMACVNRHETPETHFKIEDPRFDRAVISGGVTAVVHSHPNGPVHPSHADMQQQIASNLPWIIISLNEEVIGETVAWGGNLPICPVISRPFLHGILDCYAMIRDVYRLGREELLKQGVHWPFEPILLPEFAREDNWWAKGEDMYVANFEKAGFKVINRTEAQAGDVFLLAIGNRDKNPHDRINHGGLLLQHDHVLQHFPTRISARTPAGQWAGRADLWIRYEAA